LENKENSKKKTIDHTKNKARNGKLGMSIHIGLNGVDPRHYQGWDGKLTACEFDAKDMKAIADSQNFNSKLLLTKNATRDAVIQSIEEAAQKLKQGDELIITTSCHGGQMEDESGEKRK
jgi:metacaspase-1